MLKYTRNNLKSKSNYYKTLILIELILIPILIYFDFNWLLILLLIPILTIDIISNKRCLNRQNNFIKILTFTDNKLTCIHSKGDETLIHFDKLLFSIREIKFEKNKTEIEIKSKKTIGSKLIGRLNIQNWDQLFEIKDILIKNNVTQVKYRPEGYWSKYGGYTADIVIISTAYTVGEIASVAGDFNNEYRAKNIAFNTNFSKNEKHNND
jgi:hypothetical protein